LGWQAESANAIKAIGISTCFIIFRFMIKFLKIPFFKLFKNIDFCNYR